MDSSKQWYLSRTIWASLVVMAIGTLESLGVGKIEGEKETITDLIMGVVTIVVGVIALVGRIKAKKEIQPPGAGTGIFIAILILAGIVLAIAGCGPVNMAPDYRYQVEMAAAVVSELDKRCQDGDAEACKEGLKRSSETLNLILDGLYGRGGDK